MYGLWVPNVVVSECLFKAVGGVNKYNDGGTHLPHPYPPHPTPIFFIYSIHNDKFKRIYIYYMYICIQAQTWLHIFNLVLKNICYKKNNIFCPLNLFCESKSEKAWIIFHLLSVNFVNICFMIEYMWQNMYS